MICKCIKLTLLLTVLLLLTPLSANTSPVKPKNILILSSYSPSFPTFFIQINAIRKEFSDTSTVIDIEFMDSKRYYSKIDRDRFYSYLKYKLSKRISYDGIITCDDYALHFYLDHRDELFTDIPAVFLGLNNPQLALEQNRDPLVTGIVESVSMRETLEVIMKLFPHTGKIYALCDSTESGRHDLIRFLSFQNDFPLGVISLTELSYDELKVTLGSLKPDDTVLLLSAYIDKNGDTRNFKEILSIVRTFPNTPFFHLWNYGIGDGLLGGKVVSHTIHGEMAADILKNHLFYNKSIADQQVIMESPNIYLFDYNKLKRFDLPVKDVSRYATIINWEDSAFDQVRSFIIPTIWTLIIETVLILLFVYFMFRYRHIAKKLKLRERRHRNLFNYAPVALIEQDFSGVKSCFEKERKRNKIKSETDLSDLVDKNSPILKKCLSETVFLDINQEGLDLFEAESKEELFTRLPGIFDEIGSDHITSAFQSFYRGKYRSSRCTPFLTLKGNTVWLTVHIVLSPEAVRNWKAVYLGFENITAIKNFQMEIEDNLKEKELLLKEVHHRVNNNLALISSFLNLEIIKNESPQSKSVLTDSIFRIKAISLVHRKLYSEDSLININCRSYFNDLITELIAGYSSVVEELSYNIDADDIYLSRDTLIPLGLIVNEIITNSLKHAFPVDFQRSENPRISLSLKRENEKGLILVVNDNGIGASRLPSIKIDNTTSIGMTIIDSLIQQLHGTKEVNMSKGTQYTILIPEDGSL
jgi:two-component sensor histidine kinase